jgi:hypothetical protein
MHDHEHRVLTGLRDLWHWRLARDVATLRGVGTPTTGLRTNPGSGEAIDRILETPVICRVHRRVSRAAPIPTRGGPN